MKLDDPIKTGAPSATRPRQHAKGVAIAGASLLLIAAHAASADGAPQLLVSGLQGTSGSAVGPGGDLFVTERVVGRVSRIDPKTAAVTTFAEDLPIDVLGLDLGGPVDIAFIGQTAYVLVTAVGADVGGDDVVGIYRIDGPNSATVIADIGAFSIANPSESEILIPSGVQYALEPYRGGFLVTDGHHNRVLHVTLDGEVTEVMAFDNIVPTGLEVLGNTVLMAQMGPTPHAPNDGKIVALWEKLPWVLDVASGAPMLVDVERGRGRTLYGLAQGLWNGQFPGSPAFSMTGSLVRVDGKGGFDVVASGLNKPTSLEVIGNTAYVVNLDGEVWKYDSIGEPPFGKPDKTDAAADDVP